MHDSRFAPQSTLETGIARNRRRVAFRNKYRAVLRRLTLKHYDYVDAGKEEKAAKLVARIRKAIKAT